MSNARTLVTTIAAAVTLLLHGDARAASFTTFGPVTYARGTGQPVTERATFAAGGASTPHRLRVENGGAAGQLERVTSATVTLNGATILSPGDFNANTPRVIERTVALQRSNELTVELRGNAGAGFTVTILGEDNDAPTVAATITPTPNAAGWTRARTTVSFTCSDPTSRVVECPEPIDIQALEWTGTITRTVSDVAGNSGSVSLVVRVDQLAPEITLEQPAVSRTNGATVRVGGSAGDMMGIAAITVNGTPAPLQNGSFQADVALSEGANAIEVVARDPAGNAGSVTRNIERFILPQVRITAPADLAVVRDAAATITGTVTPPGASVSVNGIAATVAGGTFTAPNVALAQGRTVVTATATSASGSVAAASVLIYRDSIPPRVVVYAPADDSIVYQPSVTVSGMVDDIVVGTINPAQMRVAVNGIQAEVANRGFVARNVALSAGLNTLTVTATDQGGNVATVTTRVRYDASAQPRIERIAGSGQNAVAGSELTAPLTVRLRNADGSPAANRTVAFEVVQNNGTVRGATGEASRAVAVTTNASGDATMRWTLGTRAGAASNRVVARAAGFSGTAEFEATGRIGEPHLIVVDSGNQQFGAMSAPAPRPLIAVVVDRGSNRVPNVPVVFSADEGGGSFGGAATLTVTTDSDGRAIALPFIGNEGRNIFSAAVAGVANPAGFSVYGRIAGEAAATAIRGVILDNTDLPVAGVSVRIDGSTTAVQSNEQGQFVIAGAPVGYVKLLVDGSTARRPGTWPTLEYAMYTISGIDNELEMPIYLLPIDVTRGLFVDEVNGGTLTLPELPGFSLTVKPGSATFPGGSRTGTVSVTVVHADKMPMAPGFGQQPRFIVTIQPPGVHFDPPAAISFPNVDGLSPGEITEMYSFDHDLGQFVSIGTASVSANGAVLASDPGVGIIKGGWHCGGNPPPGGTAHKCPKCEKCINGTRCGFDQGQLFNVCDTEPRDAIRFVGDIGGVHFDVFFRIEESCLKKCDDRGSPAGCKAQSPRWGYDNIKNAVQAGISKLLSGCLGPETFDRVLPNLNGYFVIRCVESNTSPSGRPACAYAPIGGNSITITTNPNCPNLPKTIAHEMLHAAGGISHVYQNIHGEELTDCDLDPIAPCDEQCFGIEASNGCPTIGYVRPCP